MKTVLFVPGSGENLYSRNYAAVLKAIESKGYTARFIPINWQRTTIKSWTQELLAEYANHDPKQTVLAGFSWGAMTALVAAAERPPATLWLCSLSPYFSDDEAVRSALRGKPPLFLGKRRTEAFGRLDFNELATRIKCQTSIFIGEKEAAKFPDLKRRCVLAAEKLVRARLVYIPGAGHQVDHPDYVAAIKKNI